MPGFSKKRLDPVIMPVPDKDRRLVGRDRVRALSRNARRALLMSAEKSGVTLKSLSKNEDGAPLPENGIHWSLSHKLDFVAGVAAPFSVGIDIEKIKPCSEALMKKVADEKEWALGTGDPLHLFFRFWTAKEAVLKVAGKGIFNLSRCKIDAVTDRFNMSLSYDGNLWHVEHFYFSGHVAAVTPRSFEVSWRVL